MSSNLPQSGAKTDLARVSLPTHMIIASPPAFSALRPNIALSQAAVAVEDFVSRDVASQRSTGCDIIMDEDEHSPASIHFLFPSTQ